MGLSLTLTLAKAEAKAAKEAAKEQAKEAARAEREAAKAAAKAKAEEEKAAAKAAAAKAREAERGTPAARAAKVAKRGGGKQRADYTTGLMEAYGGAGDDGEEEEEEEEDTPCAVCGGVESNPGNEMLLCDGEGCGRGYHQYCCALACLARAVLCSATAGHAGREVRTALGQYLAWGPLRAQGAVAAPAPPPACAGGQA